MKTNYRFSDLYIPGNDETPEELFNQVRNNYIVNKDELETIKEILVRNGWDSEAEIVQYYIDEIEELFDYGDAYSWSRVKIDISEGYTQAGFEQRPWGDFLLSCWLDGDYVVIQLEDFSEPTYGSGETTIPISKFMKLSPKELNQLVGQINAYNMLYEEE